jgi:FkbM family methyltransferase
MPTATPALPRAVNRALADLAREGRLRVVLYPAGGLARSILHTGLPAPLELAGLADADPAVLADPGLPMGVPRLSPEDLGAAGAQAVLVASSRFHLEILEQHGAAWNRQGLRVVDLCAGLGFLSEAEDEAWRLGLELDHADPRVLRIARPGRPGMQVLYRREAWSNTLWMLRDFDRFCAAFRPDREDALFRTLDLSSPGYHTLLPSGARLFYPSMAEPEALIGEYLDFAQLRPGQTALDLGAYAGDSTWFFAREVGPSGRVLAVEPDPASLAALRRNVEEHRLAQVAVEGSALLDRDGSVSFQAEGSIGSGIAETSHQTAFATEVPALTLGTLLRRHAIDRVHFIKMDIEGAELRVLAEAGALLRRLRPRMVIEAHPCAGVSNLPQVLERLDGLGCSRNVCGDLVQAWWPDAPDEL